MGCGSSTLKGEKVEDITAPQPIKKVRTNFSEVDFSGHQGADSRRPTLALAPDEQQRRPTKISEDIEEEPKPSVAQRASRTSDSATNAAETRTGTESYKLEPYRAPAGENDDFASPTADVPQIRIGDHGSTSMQTHEVSAEAKGMAGKGSHSTSASGDLLSTSEQGARRKSWLARFKEASRDKSMDISDEDLKKHTGMTRAELEEWGKNAQNRAGPHQNAASGTVSSATFAPGVASFAM